MSHKVQKLDPIVLTQELIARPSVTPADAGAMDIVERHLTALGFICTRLKFGEIENLYARRGTAAPNLCFAGHTDVVPGGVRSLWRYDPFGAEIHDGALIGPKDSEHQRIFAMAELNLAFAHDHGGAVWFREHLEPRAEHRYITHRRH